MTAHVTPSHGLSLTSNGGISGRARNKHVPNPVASRPAVLHHPGGSWAGCGRRGTPPINGRTIARSWPPMTRFEPAVTERFGIGHAWSPSDRRSTAFGPERCRNGAVVPRCGPENRMRQRAGYSTDKHDRVDPKPVRIVEVNDRIRHAKTRPFLGSRRVLETLRHTLTTTAEVPRQCYGRSSSSGMAARSEKTDMPKKGRGPLVHPKEEQHRAFTGRRREGGPLPCGSACRGSHGTDDEVTTRVVQGGRKRAVFHLLKSTNLRLRPPA